MKGTLEGYLGVTERYALEHPQAVKKIGRGWYRPSIPTEEFERLIQEGLEPEDIYAKQLKVLAPTPEVSTLPSGWQITPDYEMFISPEGEQLSLADVQTRFVEIGIEGLVYDYTRNMFVPATSGQVSQREETQRAMQAQLERVGIKGLEIAPPGTPASITPETYNQRIAEYRSNLERTYQAIFPGTSLQDLERLLDDMTITEGMSGVAKAQASQIQSDFFSTIREMGRTPETEFLLNTLFPTATPRDIDELLGMPTVNAFQRAMMEALPDVVKPDTLEWAEQYFRKNPDRLRATLMPVGRNEATERLVKQLYPQITEQGLKD